ncbi:hypothetical protein PtA15_8A377 [Puccinia triticina]|uniref:Uncharacterized protein n=1 Tax=Puccinia triticina TaxID=208348 RepID=A0ABY7CQE0_9BASI|nr:uncharacterized protein PtA15_8A377 [Puccinia triticina]WAQ87473.1 hypothetical protein PtA15_8A377 [Puccinia triticina]WAR57330.1 hypothetical protein PtB15_8B377 [Puccinia triticina]
MEQLRNAQSVRKRSLKLHKQLFSSHVIQYIFFTEDAFKTEHKLPHVPSCIPTTTSSNSEPSG